MTKNKKSKILQSTGKLECESCGFDFKVVYGEKLGSEFAECHHKKAISEMAPGEKTKLEDLAIVCSNCHRLIHRRKPWKSIDELKEIIDVHRK